jgi:hypothetical protein
VPDASIAAPDVYPAPVFAEIGTVGAKVHTVCIDTGALASHATLDARSTELFAEIGLTAAAPGSCGCDWSLSFAAAPPALDTKAQAAWSAAGTGVDRYVLVSQTSNGRAETQLFAPSERAALYALRTALNLSAVDPSDASARLVPSATIVDYPAIPRRGVVEGIYGCSVPTPGAQWSPGDRALVIKLLSRLRQNVFIYGPKCDPYARMTWRTPYPQDGSAQTVRAAVLEADAQLVDFVWSLSPGADYNFAAPAADLAAAEAKIDSMRQLGVRQFALFLDDNTTGASAQQEATLMNAIDDYIRMTDPTTHLIVVGNEYFGLNPSAYTSTLGTTLHPDIEVMWTGSAVFAPTMSASDFTALDASFHRHLSVWDNWPRTTGSFTGRSGDLPTAIAAYYSNPVVDESHTNAPKPLSAYVQMLGPIADFAWNASGYAAASSTTRWQPILAAWQTTDRPCPANACSANGPLYPGFSCTANGAQIAYCDARDNDCVTSVVCPGGCKAGATRGTDVCP